MNESEDEEEKCKEIPTRALGEQLIKTNSVISATIIEDNEEFSFVQKKKLIKTSSVPIK